MNDKVVMWLKRIPIGPTLLILIITLGYLKFCTKAFGIIYGVDLVNYGQNGVIVLEIARHKPWKLEPYYTMGADGQKVLNDPKVQGLQDLSLVTFQYPSIPSKYRNPADAFGRFPGHPNSLPDKVEVVWQLAKLSKCADYGPAQSDKTRKWLSGNGYDPSFHTLARGCTWHPIPDRVFRKTIDMNEIKATEAYRRTGSANPNRAASRYTLNLKFIFIEDQLKVEADNGATNPWL